MVLGCKNSVIPTDGSVTAIGDYAFYYCGGLTGISIPGCVTRIGERAFAYCSGLMGQLIIPDNVTEIGNYAFNSCSEVTSVVIGNSVTEIGESAFGNCSKLEKVYYTSTADDWAGITVGNSNSYLTNATRYYYSVTRPEGEGNYWHYVSGNVVEW